MIKVQTIDEDNLIYKVSVDSELIDFIKNQSTNPLKLYKNYHIEQEDKMFPCVVYSNATHTLHISTDYDNDTPIVGLVKLCPKRKYDFFEVIDKINRDIKPRRIEF